MIRFDAIHDALRREFRSFRLVPKERSWLMWALYWGLGMPLWCPRFMSSYTTVLVSWVYMPQRLIGTDDGYAVLRHERVHMRDCWRTGVVPFVVSYLLLLPTVVTLRSWWEMRAYAETMRVRREDTGDVPDELVAHIATQLTSSSYLWMCPFPRFARRWVERVRDRVLSEAPPSDRTRDAEAEGPERTLSASTPADGERRLEALPPPSEPGDLDGAGRVSYASNTPAGRRKESPDAAG